jgi:hypothetical protein
MDDIINIAAGRIAGTLKCFTPETQRLVLKRATQLIGSAPAPATNGAPVSATADTEPPAAPAARITKDELQSVETQALAYVSEHSGVSAGNVALAIPSAKPTTIALVLRKLTTAGKIRMEGEKRNALYLPAAPSAAAEP